MAVDLLDIIVLSVILLGTLAYFTKGSLWAVESEDFPGSGSNAGFGSSAGDEGDNDRSIIYKLEKNDKSVVIFYGSQTGTAEDYASRLAKEASSRFGLKTMTADVEDYDFENLDQFPEDKVIGFVMASYGEGEPTDNAVAFYEFITSEDVSFSNGESVDEKPLRNLNYVIFGLGNNTYEHFNAVSRNLEKVLQKLGANRIGRYGEGDDGNGTMEEDYLEWKDDIFADWKQAKGLDEQDAVYEPVLKVTPLIDEVAESDSVFVGEVNKNHLSAGNGPAKGPFTASNPYLAKVVKSTELFNSDSRNCIHLELDISGSGLRYTTGDHLAFWSQNSNEEVERFLSIFGLTESANEVIDVKAIDPTAKVRFPVPTTYDTVVRYYLEINGPVSRQLLSSIAAFAPNETAKEDALKLGSNKELFHSSVTQHYLNTARLLAQISRGAVWDKVPFAFLIESLQHLQPRYYSISSSSLVNKDLISITAAVESIQPEGSDHVLKGVATNYIFDLKKSFNKEISTKDAKYNIAGPRGKYITETATTVPIHVRHSNFKLPSSPQKPIIMIGPGTGVAPFRGFIHERAAQAAKGTPVGKSLLFFGCRNRTEDNIYADEWVKYTHEPENKNGPFNETNFLQVETAFSRESAQKVYVQHLLEQKAAYIDELLKQGAFVYVCGDAQRMARDVQSALARIISSQRNISLEKGEETVKAMKAQNIYQEDVW
ncbi:Ncp1p [Sugiyamaella lignohabitans]|uniref:NADPH--cytochrome P450 reductase n=1 Tax=Sugiyamaella lignohabitans TaxID=796027 RepID=A0A167CXE1_9ASCO|nr:Ncp1p [Sugiyamaella lignohabitans]ANB12223.1 Ncp1p [Sugiyamaella lignohabitans]